MTDRHRLTNHRAGGYFPNFSKVIRLTTAIFLLKIVIRWAAFKISSLEAVAWFKGPALFASIGVASMRIFFHSYFRIDILNVIIKLEIFNIFKRFSKIFQLL